MINKNEDIKNQMSSESYEWYTEDFIITKTINTMNGIDLDPCSDPDKRVKALNHFTEKDDGLTKKWEGNVFMNPPYCGQTLKWVKKLINEDPKQSTALLASNTDTIFFHEMIRYANAVCFVKGRLQFIPGKGKVDNKRSTVKNVLFYKGSNVDNFVKEFSDVGTIIIFNG